MTRPETQFDNKRHGALSRYVPLIIWIVVIFTLSSTQGSFSETSRIIRPILEFLFPTAPPETITFYHGMIRKFAHFAEYFVLGFLAVRAFRSKRRAGWVLFVAAGGLSVAVSCADELFQSLNPTRTGSVYDVAIDLAGALLAVAFFGKGTFRSSHGSDV